jgi:hypothetical protein
MLIFKLPLFLLRNRHGTPEFEVENKKHTKYFMALVFATIFRLQTAKRWGMGGEKMKAESRFGATAEVKVPAREMGGIPLRSLV